MSVPTAPAPGWYPDGRTPNALRWFDGVHWTEHLAPVPVAAGPPRQDLGPSNPLHWVLPVGRSWQSIVAGYLGLVAPLMALTAGFRILVVPPVICSGAAIWLGVLALRAAATGGHGRGRAWTGIIGGGLGLVLTVVVFIGAH